MERCQVNKKEIFLVLKRNRNPSKYNYEEVFWRFDRYTKSIMEKVPKRKKKWLTSEIYETLANTAIYVMDIKEMRGETKNDTKIVKKQCALMALNELHKMQKPMIAYWNIMCTPSEKIAAWRNILNELVDELKIVIDAEYYEFKFIVYDRSSISKVKFLENMCEFHRTSYSKMISAKGGYFNSASQILKKCVDDALYHIFLANQIIPSTKDEYIERKNHFSYALSRVDECNRAIYQLYKTEHYSNNACDKWFMQLKMQTDLLNGIIKSDRKRYGKLT